MKKGDTKNFEKAESGQLKQLENIPFLQRKIRQHLSEGIFNKAAVVLRLKMNLNRLEGRTEKTLAQVVADRGELVKR